MVHIFHRKRMRGARIFLNIISLTSQQFFIDDNCRIIFHRFWHVLCSFKRAVFISTHYLACKPTHLSDSSNYFSYSTTYQSRKENLLNGDSCNITIIFSKTNESLLQAKKKKLSWVWHALWSKMMSFTTYIPTTVKCMVFLSFTSFYDFMFAIGRLHIQLLICRPLKYSYKDYCINCWARKYYV